MSSRSCQSSCFDVAACVVGLCLHAASACCFAFLRAPSRRASSEAMLPNYRDLKLGDPRQHAALETLGSGWKARKLLQDWEVPLMEDTYPFYRDYMKMPEKVKYNDRRHVFQFKRVRPNVYMRCRAVRCIVRISTLYLLILSLLAIFGY
jgi:hypothetical protein